MEKIKLVIFDLDGVIFESSKIWEKIVSSLLLSFDQVLLNESLEAIKDLEFQEALSVLSQTYYLPFEDLKRRFFEISPSLFLSQVQLKKGVVEWIESLKKRKIKCGVATSSLPIFYQPALQKFGLDFDVIVDTQMVQKGKESADVYLACLGGIDVNEALVIEDSIKGERSARMVGFQTILITEKEINWRKIDEKCFECCRK